MSTDVSHLATLENERDRRTADLRAHMAARGLDAVAVAGPEAVYYLSGLDHLGYFAFTLLIVPAIGSPVIVTREMERPTVRAQLPHCEHRTFPDGGDSATAVAEVLRGMVPPDGTVGLEGTSMYFPPRTYNRVRTALPDVRWQESSALLTRAMALKSESEVAFVRRAATLSDAAMAAGLAAVRVGAAERLVAAEVHHAMYAHGGQQPGFAPLIRPLSMLDQEHVSWGERVLETGDGLFIELSGCFRRYHAPLSRTVYLGEAPAGAIGAHAAALAGLEAARAALRPGVPTGEVYAAWRRASGVEADRHHCGYLVGIGFPPSWVGGGEVLGIRPGGDTFVVPGMTFHLMSWVAGHVVSDTALVTTAGTELLTMTPRELLVVS